MTSGIAAMLGFSSDQVETFFQNTWTSAPLHVSGATDRFDSLLNWSSFRVAVERRRAFLTPAVFRIVMRGQLVPFGQFSVPIGKPGDSTRLVSASRVAALCRQGAMLTVRSIEGFTPQLAECVDALRYEMRARVSANAYYSLTSEPGFAAHFDTHEVFVLQVEGSKTWDLGGTTYEYPTESDVSTAHMAPSTFSTSITTKRGDILYIPRGHWHRARAADEPSLHVSVGIHGVTALDILRQLVARTARVRDARRVVTRWERGRMEYDLGSLAALLQELTSTELSEEEIRSICAAIDEQCVEDGTAKFDFPGLAK